MNCSYLDIRERIPEEEGRVMSLQSPADAALTRPAEPFPLELTIGQKYLPALEITDQEAARAYFQRCVEHAMARFGLSREEAEACERENLGYMAGYCSRETAQRVEDLFGAVHPFLGRVVDRPTEPLEIMRIGMRAAELLGRDEAALRTGRNSGPDAGAGSNGG